MNINPFCLSHYIPDYLNFLCPCKRNILIFNQNSFIKAKYILNILQDPGCHPVAHGQHLAWAPRPGDLQRVAAHLILPSSLPPKVENGGGTKIPEMLSEKNEQSQRQWAELTRVSGPATHLFPNFGQASFTVCTSISLLRCFLLAYSAVWHWALDPSHWCENSCNTKHDDSND